MELAKDKLNKHTSLFNYKKGTKQFDDICGFENRSPSRIVGGREASPNQFPWLVGLFADSWFCSASFISDEWVLTAAHCVDGATTWDIYAGSHDLSLSSEPHRDVITADEYYIHPSWNPSTLYGDIALIHLPRKVEFNDFIRPACLPAYSDADSSLDTETVTATGWGKLSDGDFTKSDTLHYAPDLPIMPNSECQGFYDIITDDHLCLDSVGGHGVCNGDSGGPLNYVRSGLQYQTVGIASFVSSLGCESGLPHGFTRVTGYLGWIESITGIAINP